MVDVLQHRSNYFLDAAENAAAKAVLGLCRCVHSLLSKNLMRRVLIAFA
jgi:hypothetical protein